MTTLRTLCIGTITPETGVTILDATGEVFTPEAEAVMTEQAHRLATGTGMNWSNLNDIADGLKRSELGEEMYDAANAWQM